MTARGRPIERGDIVRDDRTQRRWRVLEVRGKAVAVLSMDERETYAHIREHHLTVIVRGAGGI